MKQENRELQNTESTVVFEAEDGTKVSFTVVASTSRDGKEYLLVTEPGDDTAYILEANGSAQDTITYRMVDDDAELRELGEAFDDILEDVDFEYEE